MEKIQGVSLAEYGSTHRTPEEQAMLVSGGEFMPRVPSVNVFQVTQLRYGVRALRAAGVSQTDWHGNQAICQQHGNKLSVVLIDFAFAILYYGDEGGIHPTDDLLCVKYLLQSESDLGINEDIMRQYWLPPLEYEY